MNSMRGDPIPAEGQGNSGDPLPRRRAPPRARSSMIDSSVWERHRDQITQLYCVENKSFMDIKSMMESEHNFFATRLDYMRKISEWRLKRNDYQYGYEYQPPRQVRRANEKAGSSAVHQTEQAAHAESSKIEELLRDGDYTAISFLSRRHSKESVDEDDTYTKWRQLPFTSNRAWRPAKDGSRSFDCPCCTNLYFFEDLFKSHLLQHLGEKPYVCVTCGDTFHSLDVLSRHYQECSMSRGSPIGDNHFPNAHAHLKSGQKASVYAENSNSCFIPAFDQKVDIQKVNVKVMKEWFQERITALLDPLGTSIDTYRPIIHECFDIIERNQFLDIASMQLVLHEMLGAETATFCEEIWELCRIAQSDSQHIQKKLLESKKELELMQKKIHAKMAGEGAPKSVRPEEHYSHFGPLDIFDIRLQEEHRTEGLASIDSITSGYSRADCEPAKVFFNFQSCMTADQYAEKISNDPSLSDCESSDADSAWMSDYSSVHLLDKEHPFSLIKPLVIREGLLAFQNAKQRAQAVSPTSATSRSPNTALGATHVITTTPKKRIRNNQDGSEDAGDSEDDDDSTTKRRRTSKRAAGNQPSFACPFAKKNPLKYRGCYAYVLKRVRDVKQHLSRFHQLPIYCPRCTDTFEAEDERDEHIRTSTCLVQQENITFEGVTRSQKILLGQRVSARMSASDQWFTIFDILFPGHTPRPNSAYINTELTVELEAFQDLMYTEGPRFISSAIRSSGLDISAMENVGDDSTALLQSAIQEGLQQVFQQWSANMPGVEQESTDSKHTTTDGSSTSSVCPGIQGSELSSSSSKTLVEDIQERNATAGQGISVREYERYQDRALPQGMPSSSEVMVADASTLFRSNTDLQNSNPINNADIRPVIPHADMIEDTVHLGSLTADSWEAFEIGLLESGDSWEFDAAFDEARAM